MFERMTGGTCDECLAACQAKQDPKSPYICRAATYDHRFLICDLFAVSGVEAPQFITTFEGRDYFKPTGKCEAAATTPKPAPATDTPKGCPAGQVPKFCKFDGFQLPGDKKDDAATTEAACKDACVAAGEGCLSFAFAGGKCKLQTGSIKGDPSKLEAAEGEAYYEKICVPEEFAKTSGDIWNIIPNNILVGHVQEVATVKSAAECKLACLKATTFKCLSGMYYPGDAEENCLLNSESKDTVPDVFVPEDPEVQMIYFDVPPAKRANRFNRLLRDAAAKKSKLANKSNAPCIALKKNGVKLCGEGAKGKPFFPS